MELQRARWRRDELGHQPLCDVVRIRIGGEPDARASRLEPPLRRARIAPHHPSNIGERPLEDMEEDEGTEVGAAQCVAADEIAKAGAEQSTGRDGVPDR